MSLLPYTEMTAFRIWQFCEPKGWDCTSREIAQHLGESAPYVASVLRHKRWAHRIRPAVTFSHPNDYFNGGYEFDSPSLPVKDY